MVCPKRPPPASAGRRQPPAELPKLRGADLRAGASAGDVEDYARANYPTVSLAEAIRRLLPDAEITAVAGTGVPPSNPTDIPAAVAAAEEADLVVLYIGGRRAGTATTSPKRKAATPRTSACRRQARVSSYELAGFEAGPAADERDEVGALTARQRSWAAWISLNAMAIRAALEPGPW
jgi:hypothetical protein